MAALSQTAVQNAIKGYRKNGLDDQQIIEALLRRKDTVGEKLREAERLAADSGEIEPKKVVGGLIGLNPQGRVAGNRGTGKSNQNATITDKVKSFGASTAAGVANAGAGILQIPAQYGDALNGSINDVFGTNLSTDASAAVKRDNKVINDYADEQRLKAGREGGDWVKGSANLGIQLPFFFGGKTPATMGGRSLDQGARGAAVGAAQYADNDTERLYNMTGGAVGGAAGQAGGEVVAGAVGRGAAKVINAKRGKLNNKAKEIDDLGAKYGVRTSVGDIKGGGIIKNTETQLERIPVVGISKFRTAQHSEAQASATKVTRDLKALSDSIDFKAIKPIEKAAQSGDRNARRVLGIINESGDDAGKILQASLEVNAWRQSAIATRLYNRVDDEVVKAGNNIVLPTKTNTALTDAIDKQAASLAPDDVLMRELTDIAARVDNSDISKSFANMRLLRSQLGDLADKYGSPVNGNKAAAKVFGDIRKAVDDDIANFAASSGNSAIQRTYKQADKFYKGMMDGKDNAIIKSASSNTPDEIYGKFVRAGKGDGAENFYRSLDAKGQATLRTQMAEEAMGKAWNEVTESFSPAKFAREFERLAEPHERIFKGEDKKQMDGFVKLMRHVERAGRFKENPPTGVRLTDVAIIGGAVTSLPLTLKVAGAAAITKTLFTTKAGKNLLLAADKLPSNQQAALDNIMKAAAKLAASTASKQGRETASKVAGTKVRENDAVLAPAF